MLKMAELAPMGEIPVTTPTSELVSSVSSLYSVRPKQTLSMHTRDGVRLDADVYYPDCEGDFPVLLMRQPYGRAIASTVVYAHPTWYAAHGYIVVVQDVRGRGSSEGEFRLFAHERQDGEDTIHWAAALPSSTGQVGMYGFSYQGMTQLYAAVTHPPALKVICPAMVAYDLYADWAYEGGAFGWQMNLGWAIQLAAETARRRGDRPSYETLYHAARNSAFSNPVNPQSALLQELDPDSFYHDWLAHPTPDEYWETLSPKQDLATVDLPMLHIGGWFDTYLRGTLNLYRAIAPRSQFLQHLWIGPWAHLPWGQRAGVMDYGREANSPIDRLQLRWFDHFLKGKETGLTAEDPICLFEMGTNRWRRFAQWPEMGAPTYTLYTTGLGSMDVREGQLVEPGTGHPSPLPDAMVHDPWRPVPVVGGHATFPAGMGDRATVDTRTDVLTYTTPPLTEPLCLAGNVAVDLVCSADAPSFDLCAVLSEVYPDGRVYGFSQGYRRLVGKPSQPIRIRIELQATCLCLAAGHALRLSLSAACFPAYPVNTGTGDSPSKSSLIDAQVITLTVESSGDRPSYLFLPLISAVTTDQNGA
jgi:putative CocE/NonD family hydrolase